MDADCNTLEPCAKCLPIIQHYKDLLVAVEGAVVYHQKRTGDERERYNGLLESSEARTLEQRDKAREAMAKLAACEERVVYVEGMNEGLSKELDQWNDHRGHNAECPSCALRKAEAKMAAMEDYSHEITEALNGRWNPSMRQIHAKAIHELLDRLAAVEKERDTYMRGMIGQENRAIEFRKERYILQVKLASCEKQWAFAKSHDSELDHVARIQQLEAKLAVVEAERDSMGEIGAGVIENLQAKLAQAERVVAALRSILKRDISNPKYDSYFDEAERALAAYDAEPTGGA